MRISPAETLDAFRTVDRMGMEDRQQLKESLALVLPKTEEKAFDACFDAFFRFEEFSDARRASPMERAVGRFDGEGEGSEGHGDGQPQGQSSERRNSDATDRPPAMARRKTQYRSLRRPRSRTRRALSPPSASSSSRGIGLPSPWP